MKALVIAEKPSVARDIARVLHCEKKLDGGMEGRDYIVTWALGHLVTLADPEAYDKKYVKWEMETLPDDAGQNETGGDPSDRQAVPGSESPSFPERRRKRGHRHRCGTGGRACSPLDSGDHGLPETDQAALDFFCDG